MSRTKKKTPAEILKDRIKECQEDLVTITSDISNLRSSNVIEELKDNVNRIELDIERLDESVERFGQQFDGLVELFDELVDELDTKTNNEEAA
jgi:hypothetical protein